MQQFRRCLESLDRLPVLDLCQSYGSSEFFLRQSKPVLSEEYKLFIQYDQVSLKGYPWSGLGSETIVAR
uniref:Uncharacterized protein n=1 Tax=Romanomermis culicivorax TaxID=13658 RepID=A0A915KB97_ROMCU